MRRWLPAALASLLLMSACSDQTGIEPSGFLGDYSDLQPGRGDQAQLVYLDASADFSPYEKVVIDRVVAWSPPGSGDPKPALQALADRFDAALRSELQREFELVEEPGPGTLRIRAAMTGLRETGASVELEVLDAASGQRLVAVADKRGETPDGGDGGAKGADEAVAFWAERTRVRLAAFRSFDSAEAAHEASRANKAD